MEHFTGGKPRPGGQRGGERWSGGQTLDSSPHPSDHWAASASPSVKWENDACLTGGPQTQAWGREGLREPQPVMSSEVTSRWAGTCDPSLPRLNLPELQKGSLVQGPEQGGREGTGPCVTSGGQTLGLARPCVMSGAEWWMAGSWSVLWAGLRILHLILKFKGDFGGCQAGVTYWIWVCFFLNVEL